MAALAERFVTIRPDTKNFRADLERDTSRDVAAVGKTLAAALAGGAFLAGAKKATDAASNLQQAVGGTAAVFGESQDAIDDWAKGAAESAGLSERAARELTSSLGGLLKGFGFTESEAADLSITLAGLGADLAATFGGNPEEAVQALGAALRGETDPLERFGIALNQTLVNQKAVELGLAASTSAVDQNAKAQATLALITERSADAQGQFARESETAAGQAAISAAKAENAAADLGENLLPIYTKISEIVGTVADAFGALPEPVQTALIALGGIAALSGPVKAGADAISALATIARTRLAQGLDAGAVGAYNLAGGLGSVAIGAGALGLALFAAERILSSYQAEKANAARIEQSYTDILSEQTGEVEKNSKAFAGAELLKGGLGEKLREANIDVGAFTEGVTHSTDALIALGDSVSGKGNLGELGDLETALDNAGLSGSKLGDELLRLQSTGELSAGDLDALIDRLADQAQGYKDGAREADNKAAADTAAGDAAGTSAGKIQDQTDALSDEEQAAKDAAAATDAFREAVDLYVNGPLDFEGALDAQAEALSDLASNIEDRAQDVRDARERLAEVNDDPDATRADRLAAEKELQDAIDATSLSLEGNSDAALRNRDDVRALVDGAVDVIQSAKDQGSSLEELQDIRAIEVQSLRDQLTAMGYTREEVDKYIGRIEAIPLTKTTVLDADTAKADIKLQRLQERIDRLITGGQQASVDVLQAESQLMRRQGGRGFAAGGDVMDGVFTTGENGTEVMVKDGPNLSVIAGGGPSPLGGFDGVGEDQLLTQREMAAALRSIDAKLSGGANLRRTALEGIA